MRKMKYLFFIAVLSLCIAACGGNDGDKTSDSGKDKGNVGTENVGDIVDSGDEGEAQDKEEKEEEDKKAPVPSEAYVLYKESFTKSGNYYIYEYNEKGHIVKKTTYYTDIEPVVGTYEYVYNEDGSYTVTGGGECSKEYYEYDSKGRCVLEKDSQTTTTNIYDDSDRLIESKTMGTRNTVRSWTRMTYDEKGLLIKKQFYDEDGVPGRWHEYDYDENGREILQHDYNKDGVKEYDNATGVWEIEYDEYGRITCEWKKDAERGGTLVKDLYEYDENGGVCKKTVTRMNTVYEYKPLSECIVK